MNQFRPPAICIPSWINREAMLAFGFPYDKEQLPFGNLFVEGLIAS